jgi:hypothetical protein
VKKEIDARSIIQIDVYDSESVEAVGIGNNLEHAITFGDRVMPKEIDQTLYYIAWNSKPIMLHKIKVLHYFIFSKIIKTNHKK